MFVSDLFISRFRSVREASIRFKPGRNIIVGKNNSGKSNIISALDILFSESNPNWRHFDENDFYCQEIEKVCEESGEVTFIEDLAEDFFIMATLKDSGYNEDLIGSMRKKTRFYLLKKDIKLLPRSENDGAIVNYDFFYNLNYEENLVNYVENTRGNWIDSSQLIETLKNSKGVYIFFAKSRIRSKDDCNCSHGIIIHTEEGSLVSDFFPNKLRDALITTTLIKAFRSPKEDLRIVHYSWYGKLIKEIWDKGKGSKTIHEDQEKSFEEIIDFYNQQIKGIADNIFNKQTGQISEILAKAISHKHVTIKLSKDKKETYKSASIFVNDGIDRPLQQKGSGIQSAIIIALFTIYCDLNHGSSGLLITEEPELYLHPQARRVISAQLEEYLKIDNDNRQVIISTHSTEFVRNTPIDQIVVVRKDKTTIGTHCIQIKENLQNAEIDKIKKVIWTKNTEMFFADFVILVEGGEEFILPSIIDNLTGKEQFLDHHNITIARVDGKGNFAVYAKILDYFKIPYLIVGDLDCYKDEVRKLLLYKEKDITLLNEFKQKLTLIADAKELNKLKEKNSLDAAKILSLFTKFKEGVIQVDDQELLETIDYIENRIYKLDIFQKVSSDPEFMKEFEAIQNFIKKENIFIMSLGALEDYYSEEAKQKCKGAKSKDLQAILLSSMININTDISTLINNKEEYEEICEMIIPGALKKDNIIIKAFNTKELDTLEETIS